MPQFHKKYVAAVLICSSFSLFGLVRAQAETASGENSASSTVIGSCNLVAQNIKAEGSSTIINDLHCPVSPEKSFTLRYVWLDSETASFLISGVTPSPIQAILGKVPNIVHNETYDEFKYIVNNYGELRDADDEMDLAHYPAFTIGRDQKVFEGDYDEKAMWVSPTKKDYTALRKAKGIKVLSDLGYGAWPNPTALHTILTTKGWPADSTMQYVDPNWDDHSTKAEIDNQVITCSHLYSLLSKTQYHNYWIDMQLLAERLGSGEVQLSDTGFSDSQVFKEKNFDNKGRAALGYMGEKYWPDDFAVLSFFANPGEVVSSKEGGACASADPYNLEFDLLPRHIFLLVAAIEPRLGEVDIQQLGYMRDPNTKLRKKVSSSNPVTSESGAEFNLKAGDSLVIPLRIELRYSKDDFDGHIGEGTFGSIQELPRTSFLFTGVDISGTGKQKKISSRVIFEKEKSAFKAPSSLNATPTYIFGPSFELKDITISGKKISVRTAPENAVSYKGETGLGSCPFVYTARTADVEPMLMRRILVGANSSGRRMNDEIPLPEGTERIYVVEREPEVTFMSGVTVWDEVRAQEVVISGPFTLEPGAAREIVIPPGVSATKAHFVGFYRRIGALISEAADRQ